jgi:hypothetical protein
MTMLATRCSMLSGATGATCLRVQRNRREGSRSLQHHPLLLSRPPRAGASVLCPLGLLAPILSDRGVQDGAIVNSNTPMPHGGRSSLAAAPGEGHRVTSLRAAPRGDAVSRIGARTETGTATATVPSGVGGTIVVEVDESHHCSRALHCYDQQLSGQRISAAIGSWIPARPRPTIMDAMASSFVTQSAQERVFLRTTQRNERRSEILCDRCVFICFRSRFVQCVIRQRCHVRSLEFAICTTMFVRLEICFVFENCGS